MIIAKRQTEEGLEIWELRPMDVIYLGRRLDWCGHNVWWRFVSLEGFKAAGYEFEMKPARLEGDQARPDVFDRRVGFA